MARRMLRLRRMHRLVFAFLASLLVACGGSAKKPPRVIATDHDRDHVAQPSRTDEDRSDMTVSTSTGDDLSWLRPVYFDLDSTDLLPATRDTLARLHEWLAARREVRLTIEGHCDEQGTEEYNVGLGQKRAQAIADYLARLGTDANRLTPMSFGALRPAVEGHDEVAWSKNRRGEFRVGP